MPSANTTPGLQTFNTAYPFDVSFQNQFQGEDLSLLYIVDKVDNTSPAQQVQVTITQNDSLSYTIQGFGTNPPDPDVNHYNLAFILRPGTLREEIINTFGATIQAAINAVFTPSTPGNSVSSNPCLVSNAPVVRPSDGALIWYCNFQNSILISNTNKTPWSLSFTLNGVSAAAGLGSRSTQIEVGFANVLINNTGNPLSFSRSGHLDIVNHQGHSYAPLYFGVLGENTLLNEQGYANNLNIYFETIGMVPIQFGLNTEIIFSFRYGDENSILMHFGNESEVNAYSLSTTESNKFTSGAGSDNKNGIIQFTAQFPSIGQTDNPVYVNIQAAITNQSNNAAACSSYFNSTSGPQKLATTFVATNVSSAILNACISNMSNDNQSSMSIFMWMVNVDGKNSDEGLININQPFSVDTWTSAYNSLMQFASGFGWDQSSIKVSPAGKLVDLGSANAWSDSDFTNFVITNFARLCSNLNSQNAVFQNEYILPSQSLYDYFMSMYQIGKYTNSDGSLAFMMNIKSSFSVQAWMNCYSKANQLLSQSSALTTSAQGITSPYNFQNPWTNAAFTNYVTQNFASLCNTIPGINYVSFNGDNYIVPCQSLYDYFWASYQGSVLTNQLTNIPAKISVYQNPVSYLFNFTNVQISGNDGIVMLGVSVRNIPGYWDTDFQIPIIKQTSTSNAELELGGADSQGHLGKGSRIDFLTSTQTNNLTNVSIEEYWGLNLFGTLNVPATSGAQGVPSQSGQPAWPGQPVKIRNADLLVVDGKFAINGNGKDVNGNPIYPPPPAGDVNTNEKLYVGGDSYLNGHVGISGDTGINGALTIQNQQQQGYGIKLKYNANGNTQSILIGEDSDLGANWGPLCIALPQGAGNWPIVVVMNGNHLHTVDTNGNVTSAGNIVSGGNYNVNSENQGSGRVYDKNGPVMPVGSIIAYGGATAPQGWLLCDGSAIPSQYTDLINVVGPNTPNLCGRTLIGTGKPNRGQQSDGTNPNFDPSNIWPLGYTGGEYRHTLSVNEMPSHSHSSDFGWAQAGGSYWNNLAVVGGSGQTTQTSSAGDTNAHNNMQPYYAVNYIIKC